MSGMQPRILRRTCCKKNAVCPGQIMTTENHSGGLTALRNARVPLKKCSLQSLSSHFPAIWAPLKIVTLQTKGLVFLCFTINLQCRPQLVAFVRTHLEVLVFEPVGNSSPPATFESTIYQINAHPVSRPFGGAMAKLFATRCQSQGEASAKTTWRDHQGLGDRGHAFCL